LEAKGELDEKVLQALKEDLAKKVQCPIICRQWCKSEIPNSRDPTCNMGWAKTGHYSHPSQGMFFTDIDLNPAE
jgi:hypothetical protein